MGSVGPSLVVSDKDVEAHRTMKITLICIFLSVFGVVAEAALAEEDEGCWPIVASRSTEEEALTFIKESQATGDWRIFQAVNGFYAVSQSSNRISLDMFNDGVAGGVFPTDAFCTRGESFTEVVLRLRFDGFQAGSSLPDLYADAVAVWKIHIPELKEIEGFTVEGNSYKHKFSHSNLLIHAFDQGYITGVVAAPPFYNVPTLEFSGVVEKNRIDLTIKGVTHSFYYLGISNYDHHIIVRWGGVDGGIGTRLGRHPSEYAVWFRHGDCMPLNPPLVVSASDPSRNASLSVDIAESIYRELGVFVTAEQGYWGWHIGVMEGQSSNPRLEYDIARVLRQDARFHFVDLMPIGDCGGAENSILFMPKSKFFDGVGVFLIDSWVDTINNAITASLSSEEFDIILRRPDISRTNGFIWGAYSVFVIAQSETARGISGHWDAFRLDFVALNTASESQNEISVMFSVENFRSVSRGLWDDPSPPAERHFLYNVTQSQFGQYTPVEYDVQSRLIRELSSALDARCLLQTIDADQVYCR